MSDFKCPMCTDCPDNCPLDNKEDTRKYSADYYKGKADVIKEFAEWLEDNGYLNWVGEGNDVNSMNAEEALLEWKKEVENE